MNIITENLNEIIGKNIKVQDVEQFQIGLSTNQIYPNAPQHLKCKGKIQKVDSK